MQRRVSTTEAIVIKRKNYGESDRILTLFTKDRGKITVVARGIRKVPSKRAGYLEVFTHAIITLYKGKTFDYVCEVAPKIIYGELIGDLSKASYSYYVCELADRLFPEGEEAPEMFDRVCCSLKLIAKSTDEAARQREVYTYALDLLWYLGFLPRAQHLTPQEMLPFIESIIERKLKTTKLIEMTS